MLRLLQTTLTEDLQGRLRDTDILWLDDNPINNLPERQALIALGAHVMVASTDADAWENIATGNIDILISDVGRSGHPDAGFLMLANLEKKRSLSLLPPVIFYSQSACARGEEARTFGAFGITCDPADLFRLTVTAVRSKGL